MHTACIGTFCGWISVSGTQSCVLLSCKAYVQAPSVAVLAELQKCEVSAAIQVACTTSCGCDGNLARQSPITSYLLRWHHAAQKYTSFLCTALPDDNTHDSSLLLRTRLFAYCCMQSRRALGTEPRFPVHIVHVPVLFEDINDHSRQSDVAIVQDIPSIIKTCRAPGPLFLSSLSEDELKLLDNMMNRLYNIAEVAAQVWSPVLCMRFATVKQQLHHLAAPPCLVRPSCSCMEPVRLPRPSVLQTARALSQTCSSARKFQWHS